MAFTITISGLLRQRMRDLHGEALSAGQGDAFREAAQDLSQRLQTKPDEAGEIMYHTPGGLPVYVAAKGPLTLNFAIHEPTQAVWIVKVERLLAAHE